MPGLPQTESLPVDFRVSAFSLWLTWPLTLLWLGSRPPDCRIEVSAIYEEEDYACLENEGEDPYGYSDLAHLSAQIEPTKENDNNPLPVNGKTDHNFNTEYAVIT